MWRHFEMFGCIPEVLTFLLTPILTYNMTVIWHMSYHHFLSFTSYMAFMTLTYTIWPEISCVFFWINLFISYKKWHLGETLPDEDKFYVFGNKRARRMGKALEPIQISTMMYFVPPPNNHGYHFPLWELFLLWVITL